MRRVSVVGSGSGAGKTSFARALARHLGLPFIELDAIYWKLGGWTTPERGLFREWVDEATRGGAWVVDGNYPASLDIVWARGDTVVWLDIAPALMLWRNLRRTFSQSLRREVLWGGNRATLWHAFAGKDALIPFFIRTYRTRRRRFERELASPRYAHLHVHRFRTNADAERWLGSIPGVP